MKIKEVICFIVQLLTRVNPFAGHGSPSPPPPPVQLALDLDQITQSGLRLREALPVRRAEYWLQLGAPDLASQELQSLPEPVHQHDWPRRVRRAATHQLAQQL